MPVSTGETMTIGGAVQKTAISLIICAAAAAWIWTSFLNAAQDPQAAQTVMPWVWGGAIGGFVVALVTIFKKEWSPVTTPLYSALEGMFLGGISALMNAAYPGIVFQAVLLTFGTLFGLLVLYQAGVIRATETFKKVIFAATGGIALVYLISIVVNLFGGSMPYIHGSGMIGIGFSLFVVGIAALNLVLDFDFIENASKQALPKYIEWYAAFGLMVTLVWLYLEILRLLAKLQDRR